MVARDGVEPATPAFSATLCCVLNDLSDFRWPPKYLRSRERRENRGWKSWVQIQHEMNGDLVSRSSWRRQEGPTNGSRRTTNSDVPERLLDGLFWILRNQPFARS